MRGYIKGLIEFQLYETFNVFSLWTELIKKLTEKIWLVGKELQILSWNLHYHSSFKQPIITNAM